MILETGRRLSDIDALYFSGRDEWRNWLLKNHTTRNDAWIYILKKTSMKQGLRYDDAVDEAICFGWIDSKMRSLNSDSFILRFTKRRPNSVWSKINRDRVERMIASDRMTSAGLPSVEEAKRTGKWDKAYTSKTSPVIPKDLEDALKMHPHAMDNFMLLSNSTRLQLIVWIDEAKRSETRKKRISECISRIVNTRARR